MKPSFRSTPIDMEDASRLRGENKKLRHYIKTMETNTARMFEVLENIRYHLLQEERLRGRLPDNEEWIYEKVTEALGELIDDRPERPRSLRITLDEDGERVTVSNEETGEVYAMWPRAFFDKRRDPHGALRYRIDCLFKGGP